MQYRAPAKLNLFLHVTGRRPDGFHDLQTAFQLVGLYDTLDIEATHDDRIRREPAPSDPLLAQLSDDEDLTVRAAQLLQQQSGTRLGARIYVQKQIPAGGGLGGGSSDAACVLVALNAQWGLHWPLERLAALGLKLGSDVPVFVHGRNAFASGRGEELTPLALPARWFLIVNPGVAIATRELFAAPELTRDTPALTIRALPADGGRNDFEPVVRVRYPLVAQVLDHLAPWGARLTGTGACVFTVFDTRAAAEAVAASLPIQWRSYIACGLEY
jgi:4-diphosphocytidyl-2-C-methyl-D-erythritol kinase